MTDDRFDDDLHYCWENRVRFEETDSQGVVFYGNYVTYQDETFSELLREVGYDYHTLERAGWDIHVVHVDLDYRDSAVFDDWLINGMRIDAIRNSSMDFEYVCRKQSDGSVVADGGVTHVAVDAETGESTRIPDAFREAVVDYQDVPPDPA